MNGNHLSPVTQPVISFAEDAFLYEQTRGKQIYIHLRITRDHSFLRAAEFRAEPRNLAVAAEFPCFRGISRNSRKFRGTTKFWAVFVYVSQQSLITHQSSVITQSSRVIRITVFTKKSEKLIQILLHILHQ